MQFKDALPSRRQRNSRSLLRFSQWAAPPAACRSSSRALKKMLNSRIWMCHNQCLSLLISVKLPRGINSGVVADAWVNDDLAVCVSHTLGLSDVDWQCVVVAVAFRGRVDGRVVDFEWAVELGALLLLDNSAGVVAAGVDRFFFGRVLERFVIG